MSTSILYQAYGGIKELLIKSVSMRDLAVVVNKILVRDRLFPERPLKIRTPQRIAHNKGSSASRC